MPITNFALEQLGWSDFQSLCHTITREILGQTVNKFLDSNDGGRDGAFTGTWTPADNETFEGEFVVQAKHTSQPKTTLGPERFTDEFVKAERLATAGFCDVYILMTNAGITAKTDSKLRAELEQRGITQSMILGADWINQTISESPRLRMLVPRVYGLGDLTQILDERSYQQAQAVLDGMRTDLAKLVLTATYQTAAHALDDFGLVVLAGNPATGKTTIANLLALAAADAFDTPVVLLEEASQIPDRWNPNERQLFWLDDVFGATQFNLELAIHWQRAVPKVRAAIDKGCKFVLTTRSYILEAARPHLKPGTFPLFEDSQVIVDVANLSLGERKQILYNHLKHGQQPVHVLRQMVPHLDKAAAHPGFTPELARRLADPTFTTNLDPPYAHTLTAFFKKPTQFLADTFAGLDNDSVIALGIIFLNGGWLASPIDLNDKQTDLLDRLGGSLSGVIRSLENLNGSLVSNVTRHNQQGWKFAHPTMVDAYAYRLRGPDLIHLLLEGIGTSALLNYTTCGDVHLQNAIVMPERLWGAVMDRLNELFSERKTDWWLPLRIQRYLTDRCVPVFQAAYIEQNRELLNELSTYDPLWDFYPKAELVTNLYTSGHLSEAIRAPFVANLIDCCIDGSNGAVLYVPQLRNMLAPAEQDLFRQRLLTEIVPDPTLILEVFVDGIGEEDNPEGLTAHIEEFADALEAEFPDDTTVRFAADDLRDARWDWINTIPETPRDPVDRVQQLRPELPERTDQDERSVFDDLVSDPDQAEGNIFDIPF